MSRDLEFHHVGIPTEEKREGERHLAEFGLYVSGFDESPFGVEWMRFEPDSKLPELVRTVPHVAFVVADLAAALAGRELLIAPNSPSPGLTVAFIVDNGAPIELMQFDPNDEVDQGTRSARRGTATPTAETKKAAKAEAT